MKSQSSPILGFLGDVAGRGWGFVSDHALLFSVLAVLILVGAIWKAEGGRMKAERGSEIGNRNLASSPLPSSSFILHPSPPVAWLAAANCQWVDPKSALGEGAELVAGRKLELASGQVEIVFQSGAEVKLHGPAIFEIQSANSGFLTIGRLSARAATPESHGFTVHSRTASTVDLGTEFNVVASEDGHSQIRRRRRGGRSAVGQRAAQRRLGVGQSIEVEPGTPSVIARIEPGEGTPAFKFPTIEPPSRHDYADASRGHAHIRVLRGQPAVDSGPGRSALGWQGPIQAGLAQASRSSSTSTLRD